MRMSGSRKNECVKSRERRAPCCFEALPEEVDKRQFKAGIEVLFNGLPDQAMRTMVYLVIFWNVREIQISRRYTTLMVKAERQRVSFCAVTSVCRQALLEQTLNQTC